MKKKIGFIIMPLLAISFLASCNNGGGDEPEPSDPITITATEISNCSLTYGVKDKSVEANKPITLSGDSITFQCKCADGYSLSEDSFVFTNFTGTKTFSDNKLVLKKIKKSCSFTVTAQLTYDVTWDFDNGTDPLVETYVAGQTPACPQTPAYKWYDDIRICYFKGWDKEIVPVSEPVTYKAIYDADHPVQVATIVTLINLLPENDTFTFNYEGDLSAVDWGDGSPLDESKETSHKYTFPSGKPISAVIKIYGNLTSFNLSTSKGILSNANAAARNIVLAETITKVPDYAFYNINYMSASIMFNADLKYVGKNAVDNLGAASCIYMQRGFNEKALQSGWNPDKYRVVKNVTKILAYDDTQNEVYYTAIDVEIGSKYYLAITAFSPYDTNKTEFGDLVLPDEIEGETVDAIIYSPFSGGQRKFKSITLSAGTIYIGEDAFRNANITTINIPSSVIEIGGDAFYNAGASKINFIGDNPGLTTIGEAAFCNLKNLESITNLPSTIETIKKNSFSGLDKLTSLEGFGETKIKNIPENAIGSCPLLTKLSLPVTLETISHFGIGLRLSSVDASKFTSQNIPTCENAGFVYGTQDETNVAVNSEFASAEAAKAAFVAKGWPEKFTYTPVSL